MTTRRLFCILLFTSLRFLLFNGQYAGGVSNTIEYSTKTRRLRQISAQTRLVSLSSRPRPSWHPSNVRDHRFRSQAQPTTSISPNQFLPSRPVGTSSTKLPTIRPSYDSRLPQGSYAHSGCASGGTTPLSSLATAQQAYFQPGGGQDKQQQPTRLIRESEFGVKKFTEQIALATFASTLLQQKIATKSRTITPLVVLDVGANTGQTAKFIRVLLRKLRETQDGGGDLFGSVVCFEPSHKTFPLLQSTVTGIIGQEAAEARGGRVEWRAVNKAISDGRGPEWMDLYSAGAGDQSASLDAAKAKATGKRAARSAERVQVSSVDAELAAELARLGLTGRDQATATVVVKIDVEGFETTVLEGMQGVLQSELVDFLVWEYCPQKSSEPETLRRQVSLLESFGYASFVAGTRVFLHLTSHSNFWINGGVGETLKTLNLFAVPKNSVTAKRIFESFLLCNRKCTCWKENVASVVALGEDENSAPVWVGARQMPDVRQALAAEGWGVCQNRATCDYA